jgi:hypothetical protein
VPILVQNPQAVGVLRHIQSVEERLGFDLCALQIRRDVRNAIEHGARIVLFADAEELYRKHHFVPSLAVRAVSTHETDLRRVDAHILEGGRRNPDRPRNERQANAEFVVRQVVGKPSSLEAASSHICANCNKGANIIVAGFARPFHALFSHRAIVFRSFHGTPASQSFYSERERTRCEWEWMRS